MVRTRIAPSPTGYPHIGTIYQALFDYAFAKKHSGKFVIRIEDTDRERFVADAEEKLFEAIDWFSLTEDESPRYGGPFAPYRQSERLEIYHTYAQELLEKGHAYFAYYPKVDAGKKKDYTQKSETPTAIPVTTETPPQTVAEMITRGDWILRMKVPRDTTIIVKDEIRGEIAFDSNQITEQVLIKSDGFPTYHFAVVVDDHMMGITHIVRGEEWISSAPKHILLYDYFGWDKPLLFHTPTLRNPDKSKLSKRHSHTNVTWYKEAGYLPEAILNFLALMGWSHPEEKEIFSLDEFITYFDLKDIHPVGPIFDLTKLSWMNGIYIRNLSVEELAVRIKEFEYSKNLANIRGANTYYDDPETFLKIVALAHERIETLKDFYEVAGHFFIEPALTTDNVLLVEELKTKLDSISSNDWQKDNIFSIIKEIMIKYKLKMPVFYRLLTGEGKGLPLPEALEILGKKQTLARLDRAVTQ